MKKLNFLFFALTLMLFSANWTHVNAEIQYIKDFNTGNYWSYNPTVGLLTEESQLYANSEESNTFRVGRLIDPSDDYSGIIFHTAWTTNPLPVGTDNYIQFHFNKAQTAVTFKMIGSAWSSTYDTPDHVIIEATNTPDIETSWTQIVEMKDLIPDALHGVYPAMYQSPSINLGAAYTDVRMVVKETVNNRKNKLGNIFVSLARMQFYTSTKVTDPAVIDSLINAELTPLLDSVASLHVDVMGIGSNPLILREDQLLANSQQSDNLRVGRLIDSSTDYSNIIWHTSVSKPVPATEQNFLQVHLDNAIDHFVFKMIGSNKPSTFDTPDHVVILATNTPTDTASWTKIIDMTDLIPADQHKIHPAKYTSPTIALGANYTDIRFNIMATVNNRSNKNGNIYVSLARFQVLGDKDISEAPYSIYPGLQEAYDAMMVAVDSVKANPSSANITKLRACVKLTRWRFINGQYEPGKEPVTIVFIGNSITQGAGLSNASTQAPPVKCAEKVKELTGRPVYYTNCGHSGTTTVNWLPKGNDYNKASNAAVEYAERGGYLFFSMMLGTNDSAESGTTGAPVSPSTYTTNMKSIIRSLHTSYPDARFVVNYPIWYSPNTHNGAVYLQAGLNRLKSYHPAIDQFVADLKAEGIEIITGSKDAFGFFEGQTKYFKAESGNSGTFYLHPNQTGAEYLGNFWAQSIIEGIGVPTAIEEVETQNIAFAEVYNLQGMRISNPKHLAPGIYIQGGKKILVR